jgi:hypothetical protein
VLLAAALLAGCGDLLAGGDKEIDLHATGGGARGSANLTGTLSFEVAIRLTDEEGELVSTGPAEASGDLTIERSDSVRVVRARVPSRGYASVRAVFTRVHAEVSGGLQVNGLPLLGFVEVDIPAGDSLVIELPVEMMIASRARETLVLDLGAGMWLPEVNPLTRRVPAAAFLAAVDVRHH